MIDKLCEKIRKTGAPIVVGLDPMLSYIPEHIIKKAYEEFGETLESGRRGGVAVQQGNCGCGLRSDSRGQAPDCHVRAVWHPGDDRFQEDGGLLSREGPDRDRRCEERGHRFHFRGLRHRPSGQDHGGSRTYAPFDEDFATVNPYLGTDGIKPFVDVCKEEHKGLFILVKTSNPSSGEFQDRLVDGRPLYEIVGEMVDRWGQECMGCSYSYVGAVVGATYPEMGKGSAQNHAQVLYPGARLRSPGRKG